MDAKVTSILVHLCVLSLALPSPNFSFTLAYNSAHWQHLILEVSGQTCLNQNPTKKKGVIVQVDASEWEDSLSFDPEHESSARLVVRTGSLGSLEEGV